MAYSVPPVVPNLVAGKAEVLAATFEKRSPHSGEVMFQVSRSGKAEVEAAIDAARAAQTAWAATPAVQRGLILHWFCNLLEANTDAVAAIVSQETGKSMKDARGEVGGAIALGRFYAGEGQRLYGRTTTSGTPDKYAMTVRQPCGVAGLIVAANTPIANVAWKSFPALICGNAAVLKAPEDTPATAWIFGVIAQEAGVPAGVLNIIQGLGQEAGAPIVESARVDVVSFTGSTRVGKWIAEVAGKRLAKISLELGGKNPFVVCDDADVGEAVKWACLSAFSNAGQRCAAGSRIIVCEGIYDTFVPALVAAAKALKVGPGDADDLGPVINERQMTNILTEVQAAVTRGATLLCGGARVGEKGYYIAPTLLSGVRVDDALSCTELFGPVASIYKVTNFAEALALANRSEYGLTACIHTKNADRAQHFVQAVRSGVAVVNAGTFGSEPHMPFGGLGQSGNGSREPGTEALDIYTELKDIYWTVRPSGL